jgi:hypothetical protein
MRHKTVPIALLQTCVTYGTSSLCEGDVLDSIILHQNPMCQGSSPWSSVLKFLHSFYCSFLSSSLWAAIVVWQVFLRHFCPQCKQFCLQTPRLVLAWRLYPDSAIPVATTHPKINDRIIFYVNAQTASGCKLSWPSLGVSTKTREDLLLPNKFQIGSWKEPVSYTLREHCVKLHTLICYVAPQTLACQHNKKTNKNKTSNDMKASNGSRRTTSNVNKHSNTSYIATSSLSAAHYDTSPPCWSLVSSLDIKGAAMIGST